MKILAFADLHLGDHRNSLKFDTLKLDKLAKLTQIVNPNCLVNIGDTVSKDEYSRNLPDKMKYWNQYIKFRKSLPYPVLETCLARERDFFPNIFQTECEYSIVMDNVAFISFDPINDGDHDMTPEQIEWLTKEIKKHAGRTMVMMSHVPIAQTTLKREIAPCVYLTESEMIKKLLAKNAKFAICLGGHFHTPPEPPRQDGNILMMMAGCCAFEHPESRSSYYSIIDIKENNIAIRMVDDSGSDILPVANYSYDGESSIPLISHC
jgi:predicted phosphodiesterase